MEIIIRKITFTLSRANGKVNSFTKEIVGDDGMVQWVTRMFAEENECGCTAQFDGKQIAIAGNIQ